jgi:hypothetical protein
LTSDVPKRKPSVWLILARVEVFGANPANLTEGSTALIQCFIPEDDLVAALAAADRLLTEEGMRRIDVLSHTRFETEKEFGNDTPEFVRRDVLQAATSGKPLTGPAFISKESASFRSRDEDAGRFRFHVHDKTNEAARP